MANMFDRSDGFYMSHSATSYSGNECAHVQPYRFWLEPMPTLEYRFVTVLLHRPGISATPFDSDPHANLCAGDSSRARSVFQRRD